MTCSGVVSSKTRPVGRFPQGAGRRARSTYYVGFDPTAASIHIGNLVQVLTARRFNWPETNHYP